MMKLSRQLSSPALFWLWRLFCLCLWPRLFCLRPQSLFSRQLFWSLWPLFSRLFWQGLFSPGLFWLWRLFWPPLFWCLSRLSWCAVFYPGSRRPSLFLTAVGAERAGRRELAELVADHRLRDEDRDVFLAVVDGDRVADHLREDRRGPRPG